jgi:hypothetical protein
VLEAARSRRVAGLVFSAIVPLCLFLLAGAAASKTGPTSTESQGTFVASLVGTDVVVQGGGELRIVELPEDGLLWGPQMGFDPPEPNYGAPSTPRAAMLAGAEPGHGCQAVPQVKGVEGFSALCPLQPGGSVRVTMSAGTDRLRVDGGTHERYYNSVYGWLEVPLEVEGGDGDDKIDTQTLDQVRVDAGPGDDRLSLGLSGPNDSLIGGDGNDRFRYHVYVATEVYEYDLTPNPLTKRMDLDCGTGADFIAPNPRFRRGRGCPARAPKLKGEPVGGVRGRCNKKGDCSVHGRERLVATFRNPHSRAVVLHSARLLIERDDSERYYPRYLTLAHRGRLRLPPHRSVRLAIPSRLRPALNRELKEYLFWGLPPWFRLTGALVDRDGDRTRIDVYARLRTAHFSGVEWLD